MVVKAAVACAAGEGKGYLSLKRRIGYMVRRVLPYKGRTTEEAFMKVQEQDKNSLPIPYHRLTPILTLVLALELLGA